MIVWASDLIFKISRNGHGNCAEKIQMGMEKQMEKSWVILVVIGQKEMPLNLSTI